MKEPDNLKRFLDWTSQQGLNKETCEDMLSRRVLLLKSGRGSNDLERRGAILGDRSGTSFSFPVILIAIYKVYKTSLVKVFYVNTDNWLKKRCVQS